jgi:predicted ATPase/DNA-binding CsgD family transcriptional regulator
MSIRTCRASAGETELERRSELPLETIVGRDREVAEVIDLLRATRFVTITGLGGTGKSRLAAEVARQWPAELGDVTAVDLSAFDNPALVAPEIARAMGLPETPGVEPEDQVLGAVANWTGLLLLDDAEELRGIGQTLRAWLAAGPGTMVLVTSRVELGLPAEQVYPLAPLSLPTSPTIEAVETSSAGALFLREARRLGALRALTDADAAAIREICARVGGMPLGVQLAAARATLLPPSAIAQRLGDPTTDAGVASLDQVLAWTLGLLDEADRDRVLALAVVPGSFDLAVVERLWAEDPVEPLQRLVRLSLVRVAPDRPEQWELLVPVREALLRRLRTAGGEIGAMERLTAFVQSIVPDPRTTSPMRTAPWLATIEPRRDIVRSVLDWTTVHDAPLAAALVSGLVRFWQWSRWSWEGRERARALAARSDLPVRARVQVLDVVARLESFHSGPTTALLAAQEAERLARGTDDAALLLGAIMTLALTYGEIDDFEREWPLLQEALALSRELDDDPTEILVLNNLALHLMERGRLDEAERWAAEALRAGQSVGDDAAEVQALYDLAEIASLQGRHQDAVRHAEAGFALSREMGPGFVGARIAASRFKLMVAAGERDAAITALDDAVAIVTVVDSWAETSTVLDGAAWLLADLGRYAEAARLIGMADRVRGAAHVQGDRDPRLVDRLPKLRAVLGSAAFDRLAADGALGNPSATLDSLPVIVRAGARVTATRVRGRYGTLSAREHEVLGMVARGATDPDIAGALGIAPKTASVHVANLKRKLGVESRIDLAIEGRRLLEGSGPG